MEYDWPDTVLAITRWNGATGAEGDAAADDVDAELEGAAAGGGCTAAEAEAEPADNDAGADEEAALVFVPANEDGANDADAEDADNDAARLLLPPPP